MKGTDILWMGIDELVGFRDHTSLNHPWFDHLELKAGEERRRTTSCLNRGEREQRRRKNKAQKAARARNRR